jgi:hypothetical protein
MVAISISVVLLSILAFVFKIATGATRDAASRVSLTERLRMVNIRLRQEIGSMLPQVRLDGLPPKGKPCLDGRTFVGSFDGKAFIFATSTAEFGRPVSVDVKYEFLPDPDDQTGQTMLLVRWRDKTGPYVLDKKTNTWASNPNYVLGDESWELNTGTPPWMQSDVLLKGVTFGKFEIIDPPDTMNLAVTGAKATATPPATANLQPRTLPSAIKLSLEFRADVGNVNMTQAAVIEFPVYRGLLQGHK